MNIKTVHLKVRIMDSNDPEKDIVLELDPKMKYIDLKQIFLDLLEITDTEHKVFKIRNSDGILVPLTEVLEPESSDKIFFIDVTNVHHDVPAVECNSPLHSVYEEAVKNRLKTMENRVSQVESFVPHLERRRQSLLERTTLMLESRIAFLDRRIDELTPIQWHDYMENENLRDKITLPTTQ